jgi:hypothetical protein
MRNYRGIAVFLALVGLSSFIFACDRRREIPQAASPAACVAQELPAAEDLLERAELPVDRVVTFEGMPHPLFFGWTQGEKNRAISKILGTDRKILLFQEFSGKSPPTTTKMTGILRRYRDLPADPWEAVKREIKSQYNWDVPDDAYVLMEGFRPQGCE